MNCGGLTTVPFDCDVVEPDGEVLVIVHGEVDLATADDLEECLDRVGVAKPVFLDLTRTTFIDGSGLQVVVGAASRLSTRGRSLTVATRSELVAELLTTAPGAPHIPVVLV